MTARGVKLPLNRVNKMREHCGLPPLPTPQRLPIPVQKKTPKPVSITCIHRGEAVREDTANLCGMRGKQTTIYACAIHGECSLRRYCTRQTVRTCITCDDRQELVELATSTGSNPDA